MSKKENVIIFKNSSQLHTWYKTIFHVSERFKNIYIYNKF